MLVPLDSFTKGTLSTFSTHQQEKYLVYSISLLPSPVRESLKVVISNLSSDIGLVLFPIVDWLFSSPSVIFFRGGFPRKSCVLYCSCYRCLLLIIVIYSNACAISSL